MSFSSVGELDVRDIRLSKVASTALAGWSNARNALPFDTPLP